MQLRLSIEGPASQVLDTEVRERSTVPDLTSADVMPGTPSGLLRARTLREFQQLKADPAAVPVPDASSAAPTASSFAWPRMRLPTRDRRGHQRGS